MHWRGAEIAEGYSHVEGIVFSDCDLIAVGEMRTVNEESEM